MCSIQEMQPLSLEETHMYLFLFVVNQSVDLAIHFMYNLTFMIKTFPKKEMLIWIYFVIHFSSHVTNTKINRWCFEMLIQTEAHTHTHGHKQTICFAIPCAFFLHIFEYITSFEYIVYMYLTYAINLRFHKVCEDVGAEDHTIDYWRLIELNKMVRKTRERKKKVCVCMCVWVS